MCKEIPLERSPVAEWGKVKETFADKGVPPVWGIICKRFSDLFLKGPYFITATRIDGSSVGPVRRDTQSVSDFINFTRKNKTKMGTNASTIQNKRKGLITTDFPFSNNLFIAALLFSLSNLLKVYI